LIRDRYHKSDLPVNSGRRTVVKTLGSVIGLVAISAGTVLRPLKAWGAERGHPWPEAALSENGFEKAMQLGVGATSMEEAHVTVDLPKIAENGAVVPVTVSCDLDNVETLHIVVDKNPEPYLCRYYVGQTGRAEISTRIKMADTSFVRGIAVTKDGKVYMGKNSVKVVVGGCGA